MLKDFTRRLFFRLSTAYFLLSFLSACAQIILRTALFVTDNDGARRNGVTVYQPPLPASITQNLYSLLPDGGFEVCRDVPGRCSKFPLSSIELNATQALCRMLATYSAIEFRTHRLEDIVFIVLHTYLVLVTIYALARESIPHIIFIFIARCLSAVWAFARVVYSVELQKEFNRLIESAGCGPEAAFFGSSFFVRRRIFEVALFGVSALSVALEGYVAKKLGRIYSERPWRVVQVSKEMRRMYRLLLGFSVVAQMAGIILPATAALSLDQLLNTYFKFIVRNHIYLYGVCLSFLTIFLPLWIALGWLALRREWRRSTVVFIGFGIILIMWFLAGFGSAMIRWTFTTWWFYGTLYALSLVFLIANVVLAIICRRNFGRNLDHYLMVQKRLSSMDFTHAHFEKDGKMDDWRGDAESVLEVDCKSEHGMEQWNLKSEAQIE